MKSAIGYLRKYSGLSVIIKQTFLSKIVLTIGALGLTIGDFELRLCYGYAMLRSFYKYFKAFECSKMLTISESS